MTALSFWSLFFLLVLSLSEISAQNQFQKIINPCDSNVVNSIAELIVNNLDTIKTEYYKINAFKDYPFQTASLFILSGVMLNDWQLSVMNDGPKNEGSISYCNFPQNSRTYKRRIEKIGKYCFGLYGSHTEGTNFITIDKSQLENVFQMSIPENLLIAKENLLDELIRYSKEENFLLPENKVAGFNELGLMQREIVSIPILTKDDYNSLYKVASLITDDLITLLNTCANQKPYKNYSKLVAAITEKLIELGYIKIPGPRNFNFVITE